MTVTITEEMLNQVFGAVVVWLVASFVSTLIFSIRREPYEPTGSTFAVMVLAWPMYLILLAIKLMCQFAIYLWRLV